jgi:hypothetical protein
VQLIREQGIEVDVLQYRLGFEMLKLERRVKKRVLEVSMEEIEQQLGVKTGQKHLI